MISPELISPIDPIAADLKCEKASSGEKTIVLFSRDIDFCVSLQLLLENRYHVVTTTDPDMILLLAKTFGASLIVADALPSEQMRRRFEFVKRRHPAPAIMMFYVSYPENNRFKEMFRATVDALFSKPLDLADVMESIDTLMRRTPCD